MFEIYRNIEDHGRYCVVYFTELGEHERETAISDAVRGEHVFDGFILARELARAKQAITNVLDRFNNGTIMDSADIERELEPYLAL